MKTYQQYFSEENWRKVTISERKKHQAINCTRCPSIEQFRLKKSNLEFYNQMTSQPVSSPQTPSQAQVKIISSTPTDSNTQRKPFPATSITSQTPSRDYRSLLVFNTPSVEPSPHSVSAISHHSSVLHKDTSTSSTNKQESRNNTRRRINLEEIPETVRDNIYKTIPKAKVPKNIVKQIVRDHMKIENIPVAIKKQIISEAQSEQRAAELKDELKSVYTTNSSFRAHDKRRMTSHSAYKKNKKKKHTGPLYRYAFDENIVKRMLRRVAENGMDLGSKMNRRWVALGKEAGVRKKHGPQPSSLNVTQVSSMPRHTSIE